eukprot:symbB.v1.2.010580.t1/scaffold695.1/size172077/8
MLDFDLGHDWDNSLILEALGHPVHWHVLCAQSTYREGAMYDAFALRSVALQPTDPKSYEEVTGRSFFPHALCGLQRSWAKTVDTAHHLLPVDSCFGGLALYQQELLDDKFLRNCRYEDVESWI